MNCEQANQIEITGFLSHMDIQPAYVRNHKWWYLSPLRSESTPSFKVDTKLNLWYDFGIGQGGGLVDLGCLLFKTDVSGLLRQLTHRTYSFHKPEQHEDDPILKIRESKELDHFRLVIYLLERGIRLGIARKYCKEIHYELNEKLYYAIGFENDLHGFELRNRFFKASSSPKTITWIQNSSKTLCVFEGFMDFLSWFEIKRFFRNQTDFLILNSLSFLDKIIDISTGYSKVELYLDNDPAGENATFKLLETNKKLFIDRSKEYSKSKDVNEFLMSLKNRKNFTKQIPGNSLVSV